MAHEDIRPSSEWMQVILTALDSCDAVVAYLTEGFNRSLWCDQEIGYSVRMQKPIIPLACSLMPYGFLSSYQAIKSKDTNERTLAAKIVESLTKNPATFEKMSVTLITVFRNSCCYSDALNLINHVEKIEIWNQDMLQLLKESLRNNQVTDAHNVRLRVEGLLEKHSKN